MDARSSLRFLSGVHTPRGIMSEPASDSNERIAIILKSDAYEDVLLALSFAGIAASANIDVAMFVTNRAARLMRTGGLAEFNPVDRVGAEFMSGAEEMGFRDLGRMLREIKGTGRLRVYLCSRGARIWDIGPGQMLDEVDSIM